MRVLYPPEADVNIISCLQMDKDAISTPFFNGQIQLIYGQDKNRLIGYGSPIRRDSFYTLYGLVFNGKKTNVVATVKSKKSKWLGDVALPAVTSRTRKSQLNGWIPYRGLGHDRICI